jgi:N-methylhydantoinase B
LPSDPAQLREMAPAGGLAPSKVFDNRLTSNDVFEVLPNPGAGYGDPVLRRPELVADDVQEGKVTPQDAERIYGVVANGDGHDAELTRERREQMRRARLDEAMPVSEAIERYGAEGALAGGGV